MKRISPVAIFIIAFVAVLAALQVNHWWNNRPLGKDVSFNQAAIPVDDSQSLGNLPDFSGAAAKVLPSVVSIDNFQEVQHMFSDPDVEKAATGSGVILSSDGIIVTNNHVVADAVQVRVRTSDKTVYTAKVLGTDPRNDIAVLKIDAKNLQPIVVGNSAQLRVGQWVMAVGNPLGYDQTVTVGVVSNKSRSLPTEKGGVLINAIQTDASINPGNSGGALTNALGQLVGINSAIISNTGTTIGIGFAIPVDKVKRIVQDIVKTGHSLQGMLGIEPDPRFDHYLESSPGQSDLSQATGASNVPDHGIIVVGRTSEGLIGLSPNGAAARAGIRPLDVILAIDGTPVSDRLTFYKLLDGKQEGETVTVQVWHAGQVSKMNVKLDSEPSTNLNQPDPTQNF